MKGNCASRSKTSLGTLEDLLNDASEAVPQEELLPALDVWREGMEAGQRPVQIEEAIQATVNHGIDIR